MKALYIVATILLVYGLVADDVAFTLTGITGLIALTLAVVFKW